MGARLAGALSHPLTLLLAGALVTSLVVPSITRQWQDHEKELAVKSQLVEDMTAQTSRFLAAIQIARVAPGEKENVAAVNDAYEKWLTESAVLTARLDARLPDERIATRWRAYVHLVEDLYAVRGGQDEAAMGGGANAVLAAYQRAHRAPSAAAGAGSPQRVSSTTP